MPPWPMIASSLSCSFVSNSLKPHLRSNLLYTPLFRPDGVSGNGVPGFFHLLFDTMPLRTRIRTPPPPDAAPPLLSLGVAKPPPPLPPMDSKSPAIHPNSPNPPDPRLFLDSTLFSTQSSFSVIFSSSGFGLDTEPLISALAVSFSTGVDEFLRRRRVAADKRVFLSSWPTL